MFLTKLLKLIAAFKFKALLFRNQCLILVHKALYGFYLSRKRLILFVRRCLIRFNLFRYRCQLVAKHGRNWRLCVGDYEVVQFLQMEKCIHGVFGKCAKSTEPKL